MPHRKSCVSETVVIIITRSMRAGTDPVLTEQRTRAAIMAAHNAAVGTAVAATARHVKRMPAETLTSRDQNMATFNGWTIVVPPSSPASPATIDYTLQDIVASVDNPFTGSQQFQDWQNSFIAASVSMPPLTARRHQRGSRS